MKTKNLNKDKKSKSKMNTKGNTIKNMNSVKTTELNNINFK